MAHDRTVFNIKQQPDPDETVHELKAIQSNSAPEADHKQCGCKSCLFTFAICCLSAFSALNSFVLRKEKLDELVEGDIFSSYMIELLNVVAVAPDIYP